jgi:hypothetical protein
MCSRVESRRADRSIAQVQERRDEERHAAAAPDVGAMSETPTKRRRMDGTKTAALRA